MTSNYPCLRATRRFIHLITAMALPRRRAKLSVYALWVSPACRLICPLDLNLRARISFGLWDAGKLLLNGPDGSTFGNHCNVSFTQLCVTSRALHQCW